MRRQDLFLSLRNPLEKAYFTTSALLESGTAERVWTSRVLCPAVGVVCAASTASPTEVVVPRHIRLPHLRLCFLPFPTSPLCYFCRQPLSTAVLFHLGYSPTPDNHNPISPFPDTLALDALPRRIIPSLCTRGQRGQSLLPSRISEEAYFVRPYFPLS